MTQFFKPVRTVKDGAREIYEALADGKITDSIKTKTVEWYKYLLNIHETIKDIVIKETIL